jgi:ribonuclease BN (tRNA processing enzyme)
LTENGTSVCYLPDHEPGLGQDLSKADASWISGHGLARDACLLIHDGQYAEAEYRAHRGWGHSSLPDALTFAGRCAARHVLLFHHDPGHDDDRLDALGADANRRWARLGCAGQVEMAREGRVIKLAA